MDPENKIPNQFPEYLWTLSKSKWLDPEKKTKKKKKQNKTKTNGNRNMPRRSRDKFSLLEIFEMFSLQNLPELLIELQNY